MNDLKPNALLAYEVLDKIDANPENWNQREWFSRFQPDCGTAMCFAGWACSLSGDEPLWIADVPVTATVGYGTSSGRVDLRARDLLGITDEQAADLFCAYNTREGLGELVEEFFGPRPEAGA